jgi:hypothetical protein
MVMTFLSKISVRRLATACTGYRRHCSYRLTANVRQLPLIGEDHSQLTDIYRVFGLFQRLV